MRIEDTDPARHAGIEYPMEVGAPVFAPIKVVEEKDKVRNFQPPVSGEIIMKAFDLKPCNEIGVIKTTIKDAILEGHIANEYHEAYAEMLRFGAELGLKSVVIPTKPE